MSLDHLPLQLRPTLDDCRISVEIAGPASCKTYYAIPNAIRGLTDWLIGQCVTTGGGIGGFVTKDIGRMISFVTAPKTNIHGPYRKIPLLASRFYPISC